MLVRAGAVSVTVARHAQGHGLSSVMLPAMRDNARARGFSEVAAPVRPNAKHREPHTPMTEYAHRVRADGLPEDPWLRVHARAGATIDSIAPASMTVTGSLEEWRRWTGLPFDTAGDAPSGTLPESEEEAVLAEPGDVVVPVLGGGSVTRVIDDATAGAALGRNLVLLRPDRTALDPWFLAGFLRGTANNRQASSYASTATRLDVRRLQLPRLPLDEQRRYGARFRALDEFERALRHASRLGEQLVRGMYDGLTDGTVAPD